MKRTVTTPESHARRLELYAARVRAAVELARAHREVGVLEATGVVLDLLEEEVPATLMLPWRQAQGTHQQALVLESLAQSLPAAVQGGQGAAARHQNEVDAHAARLAEHAERVRLASQRQSRPAAPVRLLQRRPRRTQDRRRLPGIATAIKARMAAA